MVAVLGVLGSPRVGGNTDLLLSSTLAGAKKAGAEVEKVVLVKMNIGACTACGSCAEGVACVIEDDMTALYPKLDRADVLILASPIYFDGLTAQMKTFIDRAQPYYVKKYVKKEESKARLGAFISTAARLRTEFDCAERTVRTYLLTMNARPYRTLAYAGFEEKGSIVDHPSALSDARALGAELVDQASKGRNIQ
jgi:multimeric flavodoxin WrbA